MNFLRTLIIMLALVATPLAANAQLTIPQGGTGLNSISNGSLLFKDTNSLRLATSSALQFSNSLSRLTVTNASTTALSTDTLCLDTCETAWPTANFDATALDALTWSDGANASNVWTFNVSGTDTTLTFGSDLFTFNGGITLTTGNTLILGTTQWNSGDSIDGEQIAADTIDDDSIDFADVTLADLTFDVGSVDTTEFGYLNGVTSAIQTQLNGKQASDAFLDDIAALTDPGADRILFWDDSLGDITWLTAGTGLSISGTTISNTVTDTTLSEEQVEDFVGGMLGGTETLIAVTYQDATNDIDFVVDDDLSLYDNTTSAFYDAVADFTGTLTDSKICTWDSAGGEIDCDYTDVVGSGGTGLATSTAVADTYVIYGTSASTVGAEAAFNYDDSTNILTATTFAGALTGNADTATALAANGTNCSAGSYALGVNASGVAEDCTDATTEINSLISTHASDVDAHFTIAATGLQYTGSTLALTSGYVIPLSASTTDWQTAFGWGDHSGQGYLTGNETITLSGDVTGSGATAITTAIGAGVIVEPDLSTDVAAADGDYLQYDSTGTNFTWRDVSEMRTDLGLVIGTNVQAYDADLTTYAGITPSANVQSLLGSANYAAMRTLLDLEAGTDFYSIAAADAAFEAELDNSAGLLAALSDETGTGVAVFGTAPTFTTSITTPVMISASGDPADAGAIRFGNAENVCWEASPAGTDVCLTVSSSELFTMTNGLTVTGTMAATTVTGANVTSGANPGHTHTGSSLSGIDVSDDVNLTAGRSLTLTGDDVLADAELYTDTKCIWFEDPVDTDDFKSIWANKTANDVTITEIWGESDQTVNFDLQVDDGTPADVNGTDISPAAGEAEDTSLSGDTTLAAGEELDLAITSVSGTPTYLSACWTFTFND